MVASINVFKNKIFELTDDELSAVSGGQVEPNIRELGVELCKNIGVVDSELADCMELLEDLKIVLANKIQYAIFGI